MPKIVITIIEVKKEVPGHPGNFLKGFERSVEGFYDDDPPEESILHKLAPVIDEVIDMVFKQTLGCPIHSGDGPLASSETEAVKKSQAELSNTNFPSEL